MADVLKKKDFKIRPRVIVFSIVGAMVVAGLVFGAYGWFLGRQKRVVDGFARPNFPYSDYSIEELGRLYPQYANENVVTTRTPEETHKMFVDKLKAGDLNGAVECCFRTGDWGEMKAGLENVKEKGQLNTMIKDLDTEIRNDMKVDINKDAIGTYFYSSTINGEKWGSSIDFVKNNQGIWLIKSL